MRRLATITVTVALLISGFAATAPAQTVLAPAEVEDALFDFFGQGLGLRHTWAEVEGNRVFLVLDVAGMDATSIVGSTGLMLSVAGSAAPWSDEIWLSVFEGPALLYRVAVETAAVTAMLEERISEEDFVAAWRFAEIPGTDPDDPDVVDPPPPPPPPEPEFSHAIVDLCGSDEAFVRSVYHTIPQRDPAQWEVDTHLQDLRSGKPRRQILREFLVEKGNRGAEFMTDAIQAIYGRQPTAAELQAWPRTTRLVIVNDMLTSDEHRKRVAGCPGFWQAGTDKGDESTGHQDGNACDVDTASQQMAQEHYIEKYNALTNLMAAGQGNTPKGQQAYADYLAAKVAYEAALAKNKGPGKRPCPDTDAEDGTAVESDDTTEPKPEVRSLSCAANDNAEKGCCCFRGAHTYLFEPRPVSSLAATFDVGRGFHCQSDVTVSVQTTAGAWEPLGKYTVKSARDGSEIAPHTRELTVGKVISGVKIEDGCACCIDASSVELR